MIKLCKDYERLIDNAVWEFTAYLADNPSIKSLIIGMSGGIDSAVTAYIMRAVWQQTNIYTHGYCLPILTNRPEETERGQAVGKAFLRKCETVTLAEDFVRLVKALDRELYDAMWYSATLEGSAGLKMRTRIGNMKARLRMMFLYDKAKRYDGIVVSTDNLTEYLLGFWTLHGDVGDYGPIQPLYKTEVYGMANWLVHDSDMYTMKETLLPTIVAKPTDGLGISDGDLAQLLPSWKGSYMNGYHKIDKELIRYQNDSRRSNRPLGDTAHRHIQTEFKRNNPFNPSREKLLKGTK